MEKSKFWAYFVDAFKMYSYFFKETKKSSPDNFISAKNLIYEILMEADVFQLFKLFLFVGLSNAQITLS